MPSKRYNRHELQIFFLVMLPYVVVLNIIFFGSCIFDSYSSFFRVFLENAIYIGVVYYSFGSVAVFIRNRFGSNSELFRRIGVMLPVFYAMNLAVMAGLLALHLNISLAACKPNPAMYWWAVLYGCIVSTVLTFVNEGVANWENWKGSLAETEKLRNAYQRTRIFSLKGQINPHFLFNCFNTLSGLIHEDEKNAEVFLEEMTKVHRYLLRNDDELLVPLGEEIKFASSYLYLTQTRFGSAIEASINLDSSLYQKLLPPLSLHVILEHIIYTNALHKSNPLTISINGNSEQLYIRHSLHRKSIAVTFGTDEGLDNLLNKYKLLNTSSVTITDQQGMRVIALPLLQNSMAL